MAYGTIRCDCRHYARNDGGPLEATWRPANVGSLTVLERVGFQREGLLWDHLLIRGQRQDSLLYALLCDR